MLSKTKAKYIQSLDQKKFRDEHGKFIAEGTKIIDDMIRSKKFRFEMICATREWMSENEHLLMDLKVKELITCEPDELQKVSQLKTPNKVLAVLQKTTPQQADIKGQLCLCLDEIQDPGNMGTIIRIADWFGISNIICSPGCVDVYNSKVVQATMGSITRVNIMYADPVLFLRANKLIPTYAATLAGKDIRKISAVKEGILIIGNEGRGVDRALIDMVNTEITIPRFGGAESLNAAVATGIILSHMVER